MQLTREKFEEASKIVQRIVQPTKLIPSEYLSSQTGAEVFLKPENVQHTGSYKIRGAYYKISTLSDEERGRGLITASAGNHAQGVAYAAQQFGAAAKIVMPTITPLIKVNRTKGYGADVVLYGDTYDESYEHALRLAEEHNYTFVHPFNDLDIATGQGTIAAEIFQELPDVDYIIVPVGGGGLISGVATLAKMLNPEVKVIGVEPADAAGMRASLAAGHIVELDAVSTIADGVAVKAVGDKVFPYVKEHLDDILVIDDEDLIGAFLDVMENHKMVVENAGLLSVAALKQLNGKLTNGQFLNGQPDCRGRKVVCILSGGNMDVITMASVVQHGLIQRDRIFTVSVLLPDKPGELVRVATTVSRVNGNIIKLDHNQFYSTNRNKAVELKITMEAFGTSHKQEILSALEEKDFNPKLLTAQL